MNKIIVTILFISMTVGLFYACKKEEKVDKQSINPTEQSIKDIQLEKKIISFRDKIDLIRENPNLKSGTDPMEIDSAVWYIESTSNLTYGDASSTLEEYVIDSSFIDIPLTNGQILWNDVQVAYDEVIDSLSAHNSAITANSKQLVVADISLKETTDNTAIFEVISGFATDGGYPWNNNLDWYWGFELGSCDGTTGVGTTDAADIIAQQANLTIAVPGGNSYYNDVSWQHEIGPYDVPTDQNPYGDYLLFLDYYTYPNNICMSTNELNYYTNALVDIGIIYLPTGKSVIKYFLHDDFIPDGQSPTEVFHMADIKYGVWHTSGNPPEEL